MLKVPSKGFRANCVPVSAFPVGCFPRVITCLYIYPNKRNF
jgi:hypothetical protein